MTDSPETSDLDSFLGVPPESPWRRRAPWIAGGIVLLVLLVVLTRCFGGSGDAGYVTEAVKRGDLEVTVSATGNLAPTNQVEVGSEVSGTIDKVLVDFNDRVRKGQPLAIIDTDLLDDQIAQSRATLAAESDGTIVTPTRMRGTWAARSRFYETQGWLQNTAALAQQAQFAIDASNPNQMDMAAPVQLLGNLMVLADIISFSLN